MAVAVVRLLCALTVVLMFSAPAAGQRRVVRFQYFDDYLLNVADPRRQRQNEVVKPRPEPTPEGSENEANVTNTTPDHSRETNERPLQSLDILAYFRDVPREHWSCCMLGRLAGDKGFHCHAAFYAARIMMRNPNRAHNRKLPFTGRNGAPDWGRDIMRTFQRCVRRHSDSFHKCCYAAAIEQREISRWRHFRFNASQ